MELKVIRNEYGQAYTSGRLYVNDVDFCYTHEDVVRNINSVEDKVYGETAIPQGKYKVTLDVFSKKYSQKPTYAFTKGFMPRLVDVPYFEGILIHGGNSSKDSLGCVLVGETHKRGIDFVGNSLNTFRELYENYLWQAHKRGEEITIEIVNL